MSNDNSIEIKRNENQTKRKKHEPHTYRDTVLGRPNAKPREWFLYLICFGLGVVLILCSEKSIKLTLQMTINIERLVLPIPGKIQI